MRENTDCCIIHPDPPPRILCAVVLLSRLEFPFVAACLCNTQCGSCQGPVNYLFKHSFALTKRKGARERRGGKREKNLLISHTMNKLIKRFFPSPAHTFLFFSFFFSLFTLEIILTKSKSEERKRKGGGKKGKGGELE